MKIVGKAVREGEAEGEAIVSEEPISFLGDVNPETGEIVEENHQLYGKSIDDKILIFPHGKGSTVGSYVLYQLKKNGKAPAGIVNRKAEAIVAAGAIIADIPMLHKLEKDPIENIEDKDSIKIIGNTITVEK